MTNRTPSDSRIAALFINMGGPRTLTNVYGFMHNLFNDVHISNMAQPLRTLIAHLICMARVGNVKKNYGEIGNGSPIFCWTEQQGALALKQLTKHYPNMSSHQGYSYAVPFIQSAIDELAAANYDKIVVIPLYPYFSIATLGSMYSDIETARRRNQLGDKLIIIPPFFEKPLYLQGTVELLKEALTQIDPSQPFRVVFTAHSLPVSSIIVKGDPYRQQVDCTYKSVLKKMDIEHSVMAFQSKIGPIEWMGPSTVKTVEETGKKGFKQIVVMPIGFTCDHIETLHELDIELKEIAHESGIETFVRGKVFNDHPLFIELLTECIEESLA